MADFQAKPINISDINGGQKYENGSGINSNAINSPIEAALFMQSLGTNQPDITEIDGIGVPNVSILEESNGVRLKFSNLKGKDGNSPDFDLIEEILVTEASNIMRTQEPDGTAYNFEEVVISIKYTSKASAVNTVRTNINNNMHAFDHSVGANDTYSTYRISRRGGLVNQTACGNNYAGLMTNLLGNNEVLYTQEKLTMLSISRTGGLLVGTIIKIYGVRA